MTTLNLNSIIDVSVSVSAAAAPRATFNQLLILGSSDVISVNDRVSSYESLAEMVEDGFTISDPEYLAAARYFAQSPAPDLVWIGRRDLSSSPEESVLEAIQACRLKESDWYMVYTTETIDSDDILEIALAVESMVPSTIFIFDTSDSDVLESDPEPDDIVTQLKDLSYSKTMADYTTNSYLGAGIMGVACGLNNGNANSAFTIFCKTIVGATVESLTSAQREILEGKNCNVYLEYAKYYKIYQPGVMVNGYFFDQIVNRDMLVNDIQLACMDLLYGNRKVPQTEAGMTMIENAIQKCCEAAVTRGHLGAGTYTGADFLNLKTDDALPNGYVIQREALADQSEADRALRKSVSFYVTVKEAGAVHSINIEIIVNV